MANLRVDKITSTETFETTGSVQFDGSGDYLSLAVSSDFQFGSGDFTIECWALAFDEGTDDILGIYNTGANRRTFALRKDQTESMQFLFSSNGTGGISIDSADGIISLNTWHHYAVVRKDLEYTIYLDGKNVGSRFSPDAIYTNNDDGLRIGSSYNTDFDGHISNVRIIKGKALYTENFKPPMRELEVTPETVLLACQHKTDASHEKTGKTITVTGNAVANELTPGLLTDEVKSGGNSAITGSVEFDGTGDYLLLNSGSSDFTLGTDDFTIECWAYPTRYGGIFQFFDSSVLDQTSSGPSIGIDVTENEWKIRYGTNSTGDSNIDVEYNQWYHLAYVRNSSVSTLYLNGVNIFSVSDSTNYSANYPVVGGWYDTDYLMKGFLSNFRIVKGTALYTDNFIPPTRELKKVPGTVLLCCQDSNDPTQEATGKTITGFGDLDQVYNTELVTNGDFSDGTNNWTQGSNGVISVSSEQLTITNSGGSNGRATSIAFKTTIGARYILKYDAITTGGSYRAEIREANGGGSEQAFESTTDGATETFEFQATESQHTVVLYSIGGDTVATTYDNVSIQKVNPGKTGSDFTPQVGNDGSVEFVGPTKINTENYFYLPTGDTESREATGSYSAGTRGLWGGGQLLSDDSVSSVIDYVTVASKGDALNFGDLTVARRWVFGAVASSTRGVWAGGLSPLTDTIDFVTIASKGNATDFGNQLDSKATYAGVGNETRGIFGGGNPEASSAKTDGIDYITISSKGDSQDFGNLLQATASLCGTASPTRGLFFGGYTPTVINTIQYVTIATTGNAKDFGDLARSNTQEAMACANAIRGICAGGGPSPTNAIDFVTISTMGNAFDFGDLVNSGQSTMGALASSTRGLISTNDTTQVDIEMIEIMTTANAVDFGDLSVARDLGSGCSNGHGGLG